ncbi:purine nucleoside phosphorylase [Culex quinquefasciatus]|uniref:Purine nucleoside phosphorylase n=2 Tax=Culex quinquefasciatus TaxID=7176 RepID=B0X9J9_CULQU|nr:purine nucleoside phosphorylase [Culex quinquefasciatus]|eukprot:XP_001866321.1 purine nucleoside phosphorylase [Culex quinquefasciatus]
MSDKVCQNGNGTAAKLLTNGIANGVDEKKRGENCGRFLQCEGGILGRYTYDVLQEIANHLLARTQLRPKIGIILGTGLGSLANQLTDADYIDYQTIPHFPVSTVEGHVGRLIFGYLKGVPVMCMQGRFHYYEGYPLAKCAMPVRVMKLVGCSHLIATNAAGGLHPDYKVGDIMLMKDHINIMGFAGNNPLQGPNDSRFGPRFPNMFNAYDFKLLKKAKEIGRDIGIENNLHEGVYICLGGPNFETVAELKMLRIWGVDAVGMSTVHEITTAVHCGMTCFAFSLITNLCIPSYDLEESPCHEDIVGIGKRQENTLTELVSRMAKHIHMELKK